MLHFQRNGFIRPIYLLYLHRHAECHEFDLPTKTAVCLGIGSIQNLLNEHWLFKCFTTSSVFSIQFYFFSSRNNIHDHKAALQKSGCRFIVFKQVKLKKPPTISYNLLLCTLKIIWSDNGIRFAVYVHLLNSCSPKNN